MANQPSDIDKLESFFEDIIQTMEPRFTSHEFLFKLAHEHQQEYVRALNLYLENNTPFKDLHHELYRRLKKLEGKVLIAQKTEYPSRNIFGIPSCVTLWRKKT
jgi:hypothetical protein